MAIVLTNENFKEFTSSGIVVLDFWAEWCGPCQAMLPIFEQFSAESEDKGIKCGKINVDEQEEIASEFGIRSIPTIIFMKDGKIVEQKLGIQQLNELQATVGQYL